MSEKQTRRARSILKELAINSRQSDRDISKTVHVSQPTVSRMRGRLEKEDIRQYTIIPNLLRLGYEIVALTFLKRAVSDALKDGRVVFASEGMGLRQSFVIVSVHRNFTDYMEFVKSLGEHSESFTISTETNEIVKHLSLSSII